MYDGRKFVVELFNMLTSEFEELTAEVVGTMSGYDGNSDILQVMYSDGAVKDLFIPSFEKQIIREIV